jgi:hypothetical protein
VNGKFDSINEQDNKLTDEQQNDDHDSICKPAAAAPPITTSPHKCDPSTRMSSGYI